MVFSLAAVPYNYVDPTPHIQPPDQLCYGNGLALVALVQSAATPSYGNIDP